MSRVAGMSTRERKEREEGGGRRTRFSERTHRNTALIVRDKRVSTFVYKRELVASLRISFREKEILRTRLKDEKNAYP